MGAAMQRALVESWKRRGPLARVLLPLALLYGLLVRARRWLYQIGALTTHRVRVPVVVVGNVVAGGGGKTPMVLAIVRHLQAQGYRPGVVSRGYGRAGRDCREVLSDSAPDGVGDEPLLIHRATGAPVFVAPRRIDAARALLLRHPSVDVLVCDDGLQHHALQRDMDICVFDQGGIGNGLLLPAGPLREPWPRPVDLVVAQGMALGDAAWPVHRALALRARQADGTEAALRQLPALAHPAGAGLWAVAGIARPDLFFAMLREAGLELTRTIALPDHALFDGPEWPASAPQTLLCTEKDAVKLWRTRPDAWAVPLELHLEGDFWAQFDKILQTRSEAKLSSAHGHTTA
jgi:tetraacyldisaccharide 4'-kinase